MNIIIVDDHPMIVSFYENALKDCFHETLNITTVYNCFEAYTEISKGGVNYDIAIVDHNLPGYAEKNINSGLDVAMLLREVHNHCKIVLITGFEAKLLLYNTFRQVKPEAMVTKGDVSAENFHEIINLVVQGFSYQSPVVKQCISDIWQYNIFAEAYNRQIVMNLAKGFKINELCDYIPLAEITIRKRINQIKKALHIEKGDNLITEITKMGFL